MKFFTIGYGGRPPSEFIEMLSQHKIRTLADIRLRPQRASMGSYILAKSPEKGIQGLLSHAGISYSWVEELGNPFLGNDDWQERYREWIEANGEDRCRKLFELEEPICLLCAEKKATDCHRLQVANFLIGQAALFDFKAIGEHPDVYELGLGSLRVYYTVEPHAIVVRGYSPNLPDHQLDEAFAGGIYTEFDW